jgi:hypothetical protein
MIPLTGCITDPGIFQNGRLVSEGTALISLSIAIRKGMFT